ncbi:MAG: hemerythrin domain-containing protein [Bacteroidota bacterium]
MKRHPSLIPLSRFHRSVLFVAQMAKKNGPKFKGYPTDIAGKAEYAYNFYIKSLEAHFKQEEEQLFPNIMSYTEELDALTEEIKAEHITLSALFQSIPEQKDLENHLDTLGFTLEAHVRKEERQLFQLIQATLSEEEMEHLVIL